MTGNVLHVITTKIIVWRNACSVMKAPSPPVVAEGEITAMGQTMHKVRHNITPEAVKKISSLLEFSKRQKALLFAAVFAPGVGVVRLLQKMKGDEKEESERQDQRIPEDFQRQRERALEEGWRDLQKRVEREERAFEERARAREEQRRAREEQRSASIAKQRKASEERVRKETLERGVKGLLSHYYKREAEAGHRAEKRAMREEPATGSGSEVGEGLR